MTRRERLERKVERREEWAGKAAARSTAAFNHAHNLVKDIPLGQPILVGHHSEKHHRRTLDRSWNAMGKAVAQQDLAEHHASKAAGLAHQLEKNIFSDDHDAVQALEARIAEREAERERMKKVNALYRKKDAAGLAALGHNLEALQESLKAAYSWCQQPYPAYELQNLGARIRTDKERLEHIKKQQARAAAAEEAPNGITVEVLPCGDLGNYARITFAEKPDRSILTDLKAAGFSWGAGSWTGKHEQIPASVNALLNQEA
jgi:hypothetical protein